jgi:uncharacterized membrane protein
MLEKIKNIKHNLSFSLLHFGLMILVLLIATTSFRTNNYTLQLPGDNIFANITYIVVISMTIIFFFIIKYFNKKNIPLEKLYLTLIIPLGILYCIANPLGKIPDETQHARKSMAISNGIFFAHKDKNGNPYDLFNTKINELVTTTTSSYEEAWNRIMAEETDEEIYLTYTMATYAPICHTPQALGMFIARILGGGVAVQCYAARLTNLLVAIFLVYEAIKIIPFKKSIVFFLGLLPITISEFASMSSDALTISMCIFYISYILYLKYDENKQKITKKDIVILGVSSIIVSLLKIVYIPLCLLLFILPKEKFSSKKVKNISVISIFIVALILNFVWLVYASTFLTESNPNVNAGEQVKYILTNPISYALILFRTIHIYNQTFIMSLCGEGLGNYNAQASVLFTIPCIAIFSMLFFVNDDKERKSFSIIDKIIYGVIFSIIVILVYTSLYVAWTPLKSPLILGVQARYFLPVLLLTAIVFDNKKLVFNSKFENKYLASFMLFFNLNALSCLSYTYIFNYIIEYYIK